MTRTLFLVTTLLGLIALTTWAQDPAAAPTAVTPDAPPADKPAEAAVTPAAPKAIVLLLDPYATQTEVIKQVVEALEQAGIAKAESKEYTPTTPSKIRVTLTLTRDEPFEEVQQLVQAIQKTGLEQLEFRMEESGPNVVTLEVGVEDSSKELQLVRNALRAFEKDSPLKFQISVTARGGQGPAVGGFINDTPRGSAASDGALGLPASAIPGRNWVSSGSEIIAIADDGKSVAAYCEQHPTWVSVQLDPSIDAKPEHVLSGLIGAVQHGRQCHAYSISQHKWATLTLQGLRI